LFVNALKLQVGEFALRDVLQDRNGTEGLAIRTNKPSRIRQRRAGRRAGRYDHVLEIADRLAAQGACQRAILTVNRRDTVREIDLRGLRLTIRRPGWGRDRVGNPEQFGRGGVVVGDAAGRVAGEQGDRQVADDCLEQRLVLP
jgi:hypothetical protein